MQIIRNIYNWVLHLAALPEAAYALFLVSFAESSFFPIPPDVMLIPMCLTNPNQAFFYAFICTIASVLGGIFGMGIGYYGGRPFVKKFIKPEKINKIETLFHKYQGWAIAIAGFTPVPYKLFTICAGVFKIDLKVFIIASVLSRGARFFLIAFLIFYFGEPIKLFIEKYFNILSLVGFALLMLGVFAMRFFGKRNKSHTT